MWQRQAIVFSVRIGVPRKAAPMPSRECRPALGRSTQAFFDEPLPDEGTVVMIRGVLGTARPSIADAYEPLRQLYIRQRSQFLGVTREAAPTHHKFTVAESATSIVQFGASVCPLLRLAVALSVLTSLMPLSAPHTPSGTPQQADRS